MQLFYAPDIVPPLHTLNEEESKHCIRVLRLQCGGRIHITDGRGNLFCCEITDDNPRRCTVRVVSAETGFEKLPYALTMAVAPTKNSERFEWFLEKATEVGVTAVVPLETEHSERRVFKPERGEKVVTAALKQSLKAYRPVLHPLTPFREAVLSAPEGRKFIAHCARREGLPGPRAPSGRDGHGLHRSRRRLLARRNRLRAGQRFRRDHPRTTASAHRDRGPRGGGHGIGGQRLRIR
jgi:16S rRNA (uracil1498-N3)-methyltransferase